MPALARSAPVPASGLRHRWHRWHQLGISSHCLHHASPGDVLVPPSPGSSVTGLPQAGMAWHSFAGGGNLEERTLQRGSQLEEAPVGCRHMGEGIVASRQPQFIPVRVVPALLSCLTPSSLCKGHKLRERGGEQSPREMPSTGGTAQGLDKKRSLPWDTHFGGMSHAATGAAPPSLPPFPAL